MRIFLSYRREDSSAWAGRLRDALSTRFGEGNIFQFVVVVQPGQDFTNAVDAALGRSDVALAVIGPHWLTAASADGKLRIADENDYVRSELVAALGRTKRVIPVLVGGAAMPTAARLPTDLKPLALLQAVTLRDESWHRDTEALIRALGGDQPRAGPRRWPIAAVLLAGLVTTGAVALILLNRDDGSRSSTTTSTSPITSGPSATFDPFSVRPECPSPTSSEWSGAAIEAGSGDRQPRAGCFLRHQRREARNAHHEQSCRSCPIPGSHPRAVGHPARLRGVHTRPR